MLLRSALCLVSGIVALAVGVAQQPPAEKAPRLKVRLEVSKKIADLFVLKDDRVLLKNGVELKLLRGCDVQLLVVDQNLAFGVAPDPKLPADVLRLHIQHSGEFPGMLAAPPAFPGPDGKKLGMHAPYASVNFCGLGGAGDVQGQIIGLLDPPTKADWEKVRLAALAQVDGAIRKQLGESLVKPAIVSTHEKAGWYVENLHPFVIEGKAVLAGAGKQGKQVPFCVAPGGTRLWIDTERFHVVDLVISAPPKPAPGK